MINLPVHALLLDIETTGLSREKDAIISIGIYYKDVLGDLQHKNLFLEKLDEEVHLLEAFLEFIKDKQTIYTYNGKGFDYPFLLNRLQFHKLDPSPFLKLQLVDCALPLKHFGSIRKNLEKQLGFTRQSTCNGKDIIKLYSTYLIANDSIYKSLILKHQQDELDSLCYLFEAYCILYQLSSFQFIRKEEEENSITLTLKSPFTFITSFQGSYDGMSIWWEQQQKRCLLTFPLYKGTLRHSLSPVKDYYYVASTNQLMHRTIASFIPNELKRKATKEECFITKDGLFIKLFTKYKLTLPLWISATNDLYIALEDFEPSVLCQQVFSILFNQRK